MTIAVTSSEIELPLSKTRLPEPRVTSPPVATSVPLLRLNPSILRVPFVTLTVPFQISLVLVSVAPELRLTTTPLPSRVNDEPVLIPVAASFAILPEVRVISELIAPALP